MNRTPDTVELRAWLDRWAARRAVARWIFGLARTAATALAAGLMVFAIDWLLRTGPAARALLLVAWLAVVAGGARRWLCTGRRSGESPLDLALIIERSKRLEGDLVAALQFDEHLGDMPPAEPERSAGGPSRQLRRAVIGYVAEYAKSLPPEPLPWSAGDSCGLAALIGAVAIWAGLFARSPDTVAAFSRRFLLGATRYPTAAQIDSMRINGRLCMPHRAVKAVAGEPLTITVRGSGDAPNQGRVVVHDRAGRSMTLALTRTAAGPEYVASLPALVDELRGAVYLGDAWLEEFHALPVERPRAALRLSVEPPEYAGGAPRHDGPESFVAASAASDIEALIGARIEVEVVCDNKPLAEVAALHEGREFDLSQVAGRRRWRLAFAPPALQSISRDTALAVRVVDVDGLSAADTLTCTIKAVADQPPTARVEALTTMIVPGASPTIVYHAADDVGLAQVRVERVVVRAGESRRLEPIEIAIRGHPTAINGQVQLETSELSLQTGDELRATLATIDFRGAQVGHSTTSESLTFRVADEAGVLAALAGKAERPSSPEPADGGPAEDRP